MADIKSAWEIAQEKAARLGEATEAERRQWRYVPQGERLAARYLKESINLLGELSRYPEDGRQHVVAGATAVLAGNINLPQSDAIRKTNKKVMDGLKILKEDKVAVENVLSRIRSLFAHYAEQGELQRQQTYQSLKAEFEARVQQEVQQQLGLPAAAGIDVERLPQFQQEWLKVRGQLEAQYLTHLREYRQQLSGIP